MHNCALGKESSHSLQVVHDNLVSLLDVLPLVSVNFICEFTILINRDRCFTWLDNASIKACIVIILTEAWSTVDDTSTSSLCDELST